MIHAGHTHTPQFVRDAIFHLSTWFCRDFDGNLCFTRILETTIENSTVRTLTEHSQILTLFNLDSLIGEQFLFWAARLLPP